MSTKGKTAGFTPTPIPYTDYNATVTRGTHTTSRQHEALLNRIGVSSRGEWGFTLIELLVVIAIIGILASTVLASLNTAREKTKTAKVNSELRQLRNAIALLEDDTGKWPNGCSVAAILNMATGNEIDFNSANAGIITKPCGAASSCSPVPGVCEWTATEVSAWKGPYMPDALDPWGNPYYFDNDYYPRRDCPNPNTNSPDPIAVLVSFGPDGNGGAASPWDYDCDDIFFQI